MSTIVALLTGSGSGWGFKELITAHELKGWMITISVAVSLFLSLIISLSLMGEILTAKRMQIIKLTKRLFAGFLFFIAVFFISYNMYTISIPWVSHKADITDTVIVRGLYYTPLAGYYRDSLQKINLHGIYPPDASLLQDATYEIDKVWDENSRTYARLVLLFLYTIMTGLFIAGVTLTTEVIVHGNPAPK